MEIEHHDLSVQPDYLRPESIKVGLKPLGWYRTEALLSHVAGRDGHRADGAEGAYEAQHDQHDNGWIRSWSSGNESERILVWWKDCCSEIG